MNNNYGATFEVYGEIENIGPVQTFPSGFKKVEVTINCTRGQYPNKPTVTFLKDGVDLVSQFKKGYTVKITGFIDGREYKGKMYNSLTAKEIKEINLSNDMPF